MNKEEALRKFGLTDKEIAIFLANLELGQTTVNEIARKSNTFRTYCYDLLKSLSEKGLVRYFIKSGVKYYETVELEKLIDILHEKEDQIKLILPELKEIKGKATEKPSVQFYEGKEGIKTIHEDVIKSKPKEILAYGNTQKHFEVMDWYFSRYIKERVKNKIVARVITERSDFTEKTIKSSEKEELRKTRFFPNGISFPIIKYIYNNKVATMSFGKNIFGVVLENKNIADGERIAFELMWKSAELK